VTRPTTGTGSVFGGRVSTVAVPELQANLRVRDSSPELGSVKSIRFGTEPTTTLTATG
jgi:hypothetical protein